MFLVSYTKEEKKDIIDFLIEKSIHIKINLNIDSNQYTNLQYVQEAIKHIAEDVKLTNGVKNFEIRRIEMKNSQSYFHDKLILIKKGEEKYVLIGSAGWTRNVQENNNYESMVLGV